jgi:hypothetical protein
VEEEWIGEATLSDTNAVLLYYPEMAIQRFAADSFQQLLEYVENVQLVLPTETQHDQAGMVLRWIGSYVGKVQIQGYVNPAF